MAKMSDKLHKNGRDLAKAIDARRRELKLTQEELAQRSQVSRSTLNAFLSGRTDIGLRRLLRLAAVLNLSLRLVPNIGRPTVDDLEEMFHEKDE
jgi:transcriptional regulator with XRE-family HTH domain